MLSPALSGSAVAPGKAADGEGVSDPLGVRDGEVPKDAVAVGDGGSVGDGIQLSSVTEPGVPLAPCSVARPLAAPAVHDATLAFTYDEPPPPDAM
jgi:hypothetical protein